MGINFPSSPTVGQLYPSPATAGLPQYRWDGQAWVTGSVDIIGAVRFDAVQALTGAQQAQARANIAVPGRNRLINGQHAINQRSAGGGIADNTYISDRWRALHEGTTLNVFPNSPESTLGITYNAMQFIATTNEKGGFFQVIEGKYCRDLRSKTVTFSTLLMVNNTRLGNTKIGILEWTGTEDATTGDPISSWGADGVTPTLAANWAFKNTPANLGVTTTWVQYSVTATLGTAFNNLAVLIWNDDKAYTAGDYFQLTNCQLEEGSVATAFDQRHPAIEFMLCQRYCQVYGQLGAITYELLGTGYVSTATVFYGIIFFPVPMRSVPVAAYSAASTFFCNIPVGTSTPTAISTAVATLTNIIVQCSITGGTPGQAGIFQVNATAACRIIFNSEI